jgi:hypothetical protein
MGKKLVPKIILEGTRLTFKTDIAFALNEHPRIVGPPLILFMFFQKQIVAGLTSGAVK